ncbi:hypothetical protein B0H10DRAFT_2151440 [Mycena sp. CBHHK59/15]|nr:hypothetical protein B0H10DRAFT_2151440 [Mycena sp. CBHHK59/15]
MARSSHGDPRCLQTIHHKSGVGRMSILVSRSSWLYGDGDSGMCISNAHQRTVAPLLLVHTIRPVYILRLFAPASSLVGGAFFAALRLIQHAQAGRPVDRALAYIQGPCAHPHAGASCWLSARLFIAPAATPTPASGSKQYNPFLPTPAPSPEAHAHPLLPPRKPPTFSQSPSTSTSSASASSALSAPALRRHHASLSGSSPMLPLFSPPTHPLRRASVKTPAPRLRRVTTRSPRICSAARRRPRAARRRPSPRRRSSPTHRRSTLTPTRPSSPRATPLPPTRAHPRSPPQTRARPRLPLPPTRRPCTRTAAPPHTPTPTPSEPRSTRSTAGGRGRACTTAPSPTRLLYTPTPIRHRARAITNENTEEAKGRSRHSRSRSPSPGRGARAVYESWGLGAGAR